MSNADASAPKDGSALVQLAVASDVDSGATDYRPSRVTSTEGSSAGCPRTTGNNPDSGASSNARHKDGLTGARSSVVPGSCCCRSAWSALFLPSLLDRWSCYERAPARGRRGVVEREGVLLAEVERARLDPVAAPSGSAVTVTPRSIANGSASPSL